jgi:parallel beta-helix repeat protein
MQNSFNTTPDGTTVITIDSTLLGLATTLVLDPATTPNIDNILTDNPTITTFIFGPGTYNITNILKILTNAIRFIGNTGSPKDVHIKQTANYDGIFLGADNIIIQDLSIHCTVSGRSALITADVNNTVVAGCYFYGPSDHFCVYYAGPSSLTQGTSTVNGYTDYTLDYGNVFYKNVVYSDYSGDSVSFSLQYTSQFVGNFIRGGKLAIYMCRTCNLYNNIITDSTTNGIYVSLPSDNLAIMCNKIYNSNYSGFKMAKQMEHGTFTAYPYNIMIQYNKIFNSHIYGMELNYAVNTSITHNKIVSGQTMGIYSYSGTNLSISANKIAYFNHGIYLEATSNSTVSENDMMSIFPNLGQNGIKITNDSNSITVSDNNMRGNYVYDLIADSGSLDTVSSNPVIPYYTLADETAVYSVV